MAFRIGFMADHTEKDGQEKMEAAQPAQVVPKKSLVKVSFPGRGGSLAYYNDQFDLRCGDLVYVDGKLEGLQGRVVEVSYNFKIKISDYKRVIAVADTSVKGELRMAGSHFVTFDPSVLPYSKVRGWFRPPVKEDEEYASGSDGVSFPLEQMHQLPVSAAIAERGHQYYWDNKVRYLCVDGGKGRAIVEGTENYEVEFEYRDGRISGLLCDCPCPGHCKHEVAALLQLRETLEKIEAMDPPERRYFAAVCKPTLFLYAIDGRETGSIVL